MLSSRPIQLPTDGIYFPTKTPSRGLKNRTENAHTILGGVATAMNAKGGKHAVLAPKTPFQPSSAQPHRLLGKDQKIILTTKRALGDKTPLPNRFGKNVYLQTPLPGLSKMNKLTLEAGRATELGDTPGSVQRPSSLRKHIKQPRNSGKFETPANKGNHWDISDGDIEVLDAQPEVEEDSVDDLDELEYGAPNTLDLPYVPPFDFELPDYKQVGKTIRHLAFSVYQDDVPAPPEPDILASDLKMENWNMLSLPELESDDPFELARKEANESAKPITTSRTALTMRGTRSVIVKPTVPASLIAPVRPTARTATTTTKVSVTRPVSRIQRAPSATSVRSAPSRAVGAGAGVKAPTLTTARTGSSLAARTTAAVKNPMPSTAMFNGKTIPCKSTVTSVVRTTARPAATQRPHTSTAVASSLRPRTGTFSSAGIRTVKPAVTVPSQDEVVFTVDSDVVDDFDFKFDV